MWRGSFGWRNIIHVISGRIKYSITHPGEMVRRIYSRSKVRGVGSDGYFSPPSSLFRFLPESVEWRGIAEKE